MESKGGRRFSVASVFSEKPQQEACDGQHGKYNEKDLAYFNGTGGDATKAEQGRDQGDDKKYNGVVQHGKLLV